MQHFYVPQVNTNRSLDMIIILQEALGGFSSATSTDFEDRAYGHFLNLISPLAYFKLNSILNFLTPISSAEMVFVDYFTQQSNVLS